MAILRPVLLLLALAALPGAMPLARPPTPEPSPAQNAFPPWTAGTAYKEGDLVTYLGVTYICLQAHTARAGLEPPAAPNLWRVYGGTQAQPPAAPAGLAAVADGPHGIVVTWNVTPDATGYELMADGGVVAGAASPYLHRGLAPASTHTYRVRALNGAGASAWSEPVSCTTDRL